MNGADYALLAVLLVSMGVGLWRGFVVEVLSLTVWIAAFWLAVGFGADAAARLTGVEQPSARLFLGYAGVFVGVLLVGGLVTWALGKFIANTGLSSTDRVLGLGFGLMRGLVLACVAVLLMGFTALPAEPWWRESTLMPGVQRGAEWMQGFLPASAANELSFAAPPAMPPMLDPVVPHEAADPPVPEN
ncbi:MAG TPA: CvpA family protein [Arenimonas sp.]|uniref:CvpA family protein n=1 Tax=Arenimonas sp. TaxID=1872635 RepID=UPI002D7E8C51|nr:CvpA family protein [Arenimonas sp.]HEU0152981.1 CvpA family protein [Arenimonas sp.]